MQKYYELGEEATDFFNEIKSGLSFLHGISFRLLGNRKLKTLIKIQKTNDTYEYLLSGVNIIIMINEDIFNILQESQRKILIEQEISKIEIDLNSGKIKLKSPSIQTNELLIKKYGTEAIISANSIVQNIDLKELNSSFDFNSLPVEHNDNENFLS